ncbi:MAG: ribose 5-phosphate isomerase B [Rickettsiales bacterium]|nr:ribose 5-phosphate isomerase B [Rickettsiales bacterium]
MASNLVSRTTIALASDHAGFALKQALVAEVEALGFDALDLGTDSDSSVDYPDFGNAAALAVLEGKANQAIIVCGSGIGISIAANRHKGIRAALCQTGLAAALSRRHNNANILALGARLIGEEEAKDCVRQFLNTEYEGGRHERRVEKLG